MRPWEHPQTKCILHKELNRSSEASSMCTECPGRFLQIVQCRSHDHRHRSHEDSNWKPPCCSIFVRSFNWSSRSSQVKRCRCEVIFRFGNQGTLKSEHAVPIGDLALKNPYPLRNGIWGGESYWNFILKFHFCNHVFSMIYIPHRSMSLASRWKLNTCA